MYWEFPSLSINGSDLTGLWWSVKEMVIIQLVFIYRWPFCTRKTISYFKKAKKMYEWLRLEIFGYITEIMLTYTVLIVSS